MGGGDTSDRVTVCECINQRNQRLQHGEAINPSNHVLQLLSSTSFTCPSPKSPAFNSSGTKRPSCDGSTTPDPDKEEWRLTEDGLELHACSLRRVAEIRRTGTRRPSRQCNHTEVRRRHRLDGKSSKAAARPHGKFN